MNDCEVKLMLVAVIDLKDAYFSANKDFHRIKSKRTRVLILDNPRGILF
ncbi:MAG: hypothetical protein ACLUKN_09120 [Bacilli bacterium]